MNIVDGTLVENKINGTEVSGGRLSALFKPSENFSLDLTAYFQDINSDNADAYEVDPTTLKPLYGGRVVPRATTTSPRISSTTSTARRSTGTSAACRCSR